MIDGLPQPLRSALQLLRSFGWLLQMAGERMAIHAPVHLRKAFVPRWHMTRRGIDLRLKSLARCLERCDDFPSPSAGGNNKNERDHSPQRSSAGSFQRVQIRSQFTAGDAGDALNRQHAKRRHLIPLRDGLWGNAERTRESRLASSVGNRSLQSFFFVSHGTDIKHGFT